jgi:hypothetical protein
MKNTIIILFFSLLIHNLYGNDDSLFFKKHIDFYIGAEYQFNPIFYGDSYQKKSRYLPGLNVNKNISGFNINFSADYNFLKIKSSIRYCFSARYGYVYSGNLDSLNNGNRFHRTTIVNYDFTFGNEIMFIKRFNIAKTTFAVNIGYVWKNLGSYYGYTIRLEKFIYLRGIQDLRYRGLSCGIILFFNKIDFSTKFIFIQEENHRFENTRPFIIPTFTVNYHIL